MNNEERNYKLLFFSQPIGDFALTVLPISEIMDIYRIDRRSELENGIQRDAVQSRLREIAAYIDDPNNSEELCFPTPILMALPNIDDFLSQSKYYKLNGSNKTPETITFAGKHFASVIDGQHRILGIERSAKYREGNLNLEIPVVFVFDPTIETSALIFSTINGNQRPVPYSIVADLFGLSSKRRPESVAHQLVVELNGNEKSPFYKRIKMLGKKNYPLETLSQGPFVRALVKMMDKENKFFYKLYASEEDSKILSLLFTYFSSLSIIFNKEWNNPDKYILTRSIGLQAMMKALPDIINLAKEKRNENKNHFGLEPFLLEHFRKIKSESNFKEFTSDNFSSSMKDANELAKILVNK